MSDKNNIEKIDLDKVDWRGSREFFESLGEALDKLDNKDESYDFTWVGKRKAILEAGAPINKTFRPDVESSKNWDTTENLFIEGDNLDALKLLQESYLGKVKMIYIDPPYNTGKDFVYHDNFKATTADYDEDTEYKDSKGNIQFKKNEKSNGRYHSDWLSMMYPRLKLARNLLSEDGIVFMSIDDNEQANLKKLCDEIFGEDNFVESFINRSNPRGNQAKKYTASEHEYILCYARQISEIAPLGFIKDADEFINEDEGGKYAETGLRKRGAGSRREDAPNQYFPIFVNPDTKEISVIYHDDWVEVLPKLSDGSEGRWRWSIDSVKNDDNRLLARGVRRNGGIEYDIFVKVYFTGEQIKKIKSIFTEKEVNNENATEELKKLFDKNIFDYPKPVYTIKKLIESTAGNKDIIIDFFSGSATTAHATLQLNAEDGGNRRWIMVQLPEETDKKSEAHKAGYKTIPEISRERIRRAGDKIAKEHPQSVIDYGFRSLIVADTNYKEVYKVAGGYKQSTLLDAVDNIKDDRSELDLLFGVLTQSAFELNRPLEVRDIAGATVYLYDYFSEASGMVACFANNVPEDTIKAIAKLKPLTAVFRDSSFANSQSKVNLSEHFRILSPDTKVKVI